MRVISGTSRGTKLLSPDGTNTRPTSDSIKESLFNIIAPYISGAVFLDLFGGSGAIGIEALSRGADSVVFVEKDLAAVEIIKKNLIKTQLTYKAIIYNIDVNEYLDKLSVLNMKFDIIFLDPPYKLNDINIIIDMILSRDILAENGLLIVEHWQRSKINEVSPYEIIRRKDYGKETSITFIKKEFENI